MCKKTKRNAFISWIASKATLEMSQQITERLKGSHSSGFKIEVPENSVRRQLNFDVSVEECHGVSCPSRLYTKSCISRADSWFSISAPSILRKIY
jgi:hypothetical protein